MSEIIPPTTSKWANLSEKLAVVKSIGTVIIGIIVGYAAMAVQSANQTNAIKETDNKIQILERRMDERGAERDRQIDGLERRMVTKEIFEERTGTILKEIQLIRSESKKDREVRYQPYDKSN